MASTTLRRLAAATTVALIAGLALTGTSTSASAATCQSATAPANTDVANQAPTPVADTATVLAGTTVTIKPLANDTDPDGDRLYLTDATTPARGEICLHKNGTLDYLAGPGRYDRTDRFTYGITDGDRYRTATVTVSVSGLKPMRPTLTRKLVKKHGKVTQRAKLSFTNPNPYRMWLLAGGSRRHGPYVDRYIYPGHTFTMTTKERRIHYVTVLDPRDSEEPVLVNLGTINTRTGVVRGQYLGEPVFGFRTADARASRDLWARVR